MGGKVNPTRGLNLLLAMVDWSTWALLFVIAIHFVFPTIAEVFSALV